MPRIPLITYTDGTGTPQTLDFLYPPTGKPAFSGTAQRNDTFSTAGVRQTVTLRADSTYPINMANILEGDDLESWKLFVAFAQIGGSFVYYPDKDNPDDFHPCFLVETAATLKRESPGVYSFSGTFQKEVVG